MMTISVCQALRTLEEGLMGQWRPYQSGEAPWLVT